MTDNEIIKALECCFVESDCTECPLHKKYEKDCLEEAATKALDLINRQKAEIDRLQQMLEAAIAGQETLQKFIIPKEPRKEGLSDWFCPSCGVQIKYDSLNMPIDHAPGRCVECGQVFEWKGVKQNESNHASELGQASEISEG